MIQNKSKEHFPLIFLHDVEWPYARRDLYYNPDNIPQEYVNKYAKRGIDLHSKQLSEKYGVNKGLNNAVESGNVKNGVLTAVEDFLKITNFDLKFFVIPGFHGLGIIYDQTIYLNNSDFKRSIDDLMGILKHLNHYIPQLNSEQNEMLNQNAILYSELLFKIETIRNMDDMIHRRDNWLLDKDATISKRDLVISQKNVDISYRDRMLREKDRSIQKKDIIIKKRNDEVKKAQDQLY